MKTIALEAVVVDSMLTPGLDSQVQLLTLTTSSFMRCMSGGTEYFVVAVEKCRLVAPMGGSPSVPDRSLCHTPLRRILWVPVLEDGWELLKKKILRHSS